MGQYLQFRSWARRSSGPEKALAGTAVAVVLSLTGLALVPTSGDRQDVLTTADGGMVTEEQAAGAAGVDGDADASGAGAPGAADDGGVAAGPGTVSGGTGDSTSGAGGGTGSASSSGSAGSGTAPSSGSASGAPGVPAAPAAPGAAAPLKAGCNVPTDVGITATSIKLVAVLLNLGGAIGNSAVGISSPEQQKRVANAMVAELNAGGGIRCRKVVLDFVEGNPIDQSSSRRACLQIVEGGYWAAIDMGGFSFPPGAVACVAQRKVPIITLSGATTSETRQSSPYLLNVSFDVGKAARASILGMQQQGFFDKAKGFKKLGLFVDQCSPEVNRAVLDTLAAVGIAKGSISTYAFSCPGGGFASPSEASGGVVKHRQDGVTHVIPVTGGGSFKNYSSFAQQQGYKPVYTVLDYNSMTVTTTGATGPDRENFDGTVMVTSTKTGMTAADFDAPTKVCAGIFARRGVPVEWMTNGFLIGPFCSLFLTADTAAEKAPSLRRVDLARGMAAARSIGMATPLQDGEFSATDLSGSDYQWVIQYRASCNCWKVLDRKAKRSFG